MNELEMMGWLIGAIVLLITFVYTVTKPFVHNKIQQETALKELRDEQNEKNAKLEQRVYKLNEQIKKEVQESNKELIYSINELTITMKLFNQTLEGWREIFNKQDEFNEEMEMEMQAVKDELKDFKHHCEKIQYFKKREPE